MKSDKLTNKYISLFWLPLALTWIMMSLEGPFISAIIARLPEAKFNLAAYGVAFAFALILESPIIMMMSASTSLVRSYPSFQKLFRFTGLLNIVITLLTIVILWPPIYNFIMYDLIQLPEHIGYLTHRAILLLLPWPAMIGFRRFYQGILIRYNQTRKVAYGTIIRLVSMATSALIFGIRTNLPGAWVGAIALSTGVTMEAFASRIMAHRSILILKELRDYLPDEKRMNYKELFVFYYPLALTSMLSLGVHPFVTFFLGKSRMAIESLAVLPVVNGLVFLFRSIGLSYQEVAIALVGGKFEHYAEVKKFAIRLFLGVLITLGMVAFTPLSDFWYQTVSGLKPDLAHFAVIPTRILIILPACTVWLSMQRAILVAGNYTKPITFGTGTEVIGILIILWIGVTVFDLVGIIAAAIAFTLGRLMANFYLMKPYNKIIQSYQSG
jgi:Na+-driven multidrug efflux pump